MSKSASRSTSIAPRRIPTLVMLGFGAVALGISAYLTVQTAILGSEPIGCGSGSGCAAVLSSKWSKWFGVPVSALAAGLYAGFLWNLVAIRRSEPSRQRRQWTLIIAAATLVLCAAVWFMTLQLFVVRALCVYCLAAHVSGGALGIIVLGEARQARRLGSFRLAAGLVLGVAATAGLVAGQLASSTPVHRVTILDGALDLDPSEEPLLGSPDAECILVVMYDYACPHCRHTHGLITGVRAREGKDRVAVLSLHVPMNRACNPHAPEDPGERFAKSCELARLALAVRYSGAETARASYEAFDAWLFEPETPRTPEAARAEAVRLVGAPALDAALAKPEIAEKIRRNVESYKKSGATGVPLVIAPNREAVVGRIDDEEVVAELVREALAATETTP